MIRLKGIYVRSNPHDRNRLAPFSQRPWPGITRATCVALLVLALACAALAQTSQPDQSNKDYAGMSLEDLMKVEVETVYGASKFPQKITEAPASITIITADEIARYGYRTLADILRSVRGFYVQYDRNYSYVGTRGFLRPGDYNSRILLLVDGQRINESFYDSAYYGTEFAFDVDLIEQIEIIRGPGSSLYGANAFLGVINIVTRKGEKTHGFQITLEGESYAGVKGRLSYGNRFKNGLDVLLSTSFYDSRGQRRLYYPEFDAPETNHGIAEDADDDRQRQFFGKLTWKNFVLEGTNYERTKGVPTASFGTVFNDRRNRTTDGGTLVSLKYERLLAGDTRLEARLNLHHYYYTGSYVYENPQAPPPRTINMDEFDGKWWGTEVNVMKGLADKHTLTAGVEYRDNFQEDQRNFDVEPFALYFDERHGSRIFAAYAQDEYAVASKLRLNAGLRYDHYDTFGSTWSPRLGAIYNPARQTWLKLLYGQAFRAPNAYELHYLYPGSFKTNPQLKPEHMHIGEMILEQYLGAHCRLSASAYMYRAADLIGQQVDPLDGLAQFKNADRLDAKGLELEFEAKLRNGLEGRASYVDQRSRNPLTGAEAVNSPHRLAYFNLSLPWLARQFYTSVEANFVGQRQTVQGAGAAGVWLTNLTLLKRQLAPGLEASLSLYNLFDRKYGDPASDEHLQNTIGQDGRTFRVKLTYRFALPQ